MNRKILFVAAFGCATISVPALAGEVIGNGGDNPLAGASICQFSGLNDYPDGSQSGPPGRTQSYGQDVRAGRADPVEDKIEFPGNLCNPNVLPMKPIGNSGD